jgi:hypothetical protein
MKSNYDFYNVSEEYNSVNIDEIIKERKKKYKNLVLNIVII